MKNFLFPFPLKFLGLFLTVAGTILAVFYLLFDFRLTLPVFAVFSSFLETKMFVTFRTNFADELILLLLITGFGFLVFSKERQENEILEKVRLNAIFKALYANTVFLLFSVLFIYGGGFMGVLIFNLISVQVFYVVFFYVAKHNE